MGVPLTFSQSHSLISMSSEDERMYGSTGCTAIDLWQHEGHAQVQHDIFCIRSNVCRGFLSSEQCYGALRIEPTTRKTDTAQHLM